MKVIIKERVRWKDGRWKEGRREGGKERRQWDRRSDYCARRHATAADDGQWRTLMKASGKRKGAMPPVLPT